MSKLGKLLKELCSNGIEYRKLKDICEINTGEQLNKDKLSKEGLYPVINGGVEPSGYWDTYNTDENTITISQGGASAGYVNFIGGKFWAGSHCYRITDVESNIINKFLYYCLKSQENIFIESQQGAGIPNLTRDTIDRIKIPVPPLPVQEEIVKILDSFEESQKELQKELRLRQKQYEYYRDSLLNFDNYTLNSIT